MKHLTQLVAGLAMTAFVPLFLLAGENAAENDPSAELISAMKRSGENAPQLRKALEKVPADQREGLEFLIRNMPISDLTTLSADFLLENVDYAYQAWNNSPWKSKVSTDLFLNYVLPYASITERRDDWRKEFYERFRPLVKEAKTPAEAAVRLNHTVFATLKVKYSTKRKRADQGPFESMESGLASCSGLSVILVDACRAVGVPARFVGTPLWSDKSGNHSWVEIWSDGWHFTGAAEPAGDKLDQAWFIGRASGADRNHPLHAIYATSFRPTGLTFPMVWARDRRDIGAVNVTDRYTRLRQKLPDGSIEVRFKATVGADRRTADVTVCDATGKLIFQGKTNNEQFDANDHLSAVLPGPGDYCLHLRLGERSIDTVISAKESGQLIAFDLGTPAGKVAKWRAWREADEHVFQSQEGRRLQAAVVRYFALPPDRRAEFLFPTTADSTLTSAPSTARKLTWSAYCRGYEANRLAKDWQARQATYQKYTSPYVVRTVGKQPADGWPLFIAMHGGGGVPKEINDSQWRVMQRYYRDQASVEGYLYLAIRAPTDQWNGFYNSYNLGVTSNLIRQLLIHANVDPNRVYLMGYSHGGYGAFYIGRQMPDRFAAIHASAAAPSIGNEVGINLRNTRFTFMVGEKDTRYGRLPRCQSFAEFMKKTRGSRTDIYPVEFQYQPGHGHTGLPDRDKIKEMFGYRRQPVPDEVIWLSTAANVNMLNWLQLDPSGGGRRIAASCRKNVLTITGDKTDRATIWLDERLADYQRPLTIVAGGQTKKISLAASLKALCQSLADRGDPELMFTTRVDVDLGASVGE